MKHSVSPAPVVVVGGGHAGAEAAHACARMGVRAILVTHRRDRIGEMSCNPAIGGLGKGHLVAEIDALDGLMGRVADAAGIQFRLLNRSKGAAVRGPRAQCDRALYRTAMQAELMRAVSIEIVEGEVVDLIETGGSISGVVLSSGERLPASAVVLTTGTFLGGTLFCGSKRSPGGRIGDASATRLARRIRDAGLPIGRLKTGTPPRLDGRTVHLDNIERQPGDAQPVMFSAFSRGPTARQVACHITRTNPQTHEIIAENLHRSPVYSGAIAGTGPRYCPSIEDKIGRFPDRESHQIFLEPEGLEGDLIYPNGISTCLPVEVQEDLVHSIAGLEEARLVRPGYAVEYDFVNPQALHRTLELRALPRLFLAGQINGTTGYEEAAAQGLIAGINAAAAALGKAPVIVDRADGYLGVLIDDLVTQGVREPYRMFTSRAEFRLLLRADNADRRLTPKGIAIGCVGPERQRLFESKMTNLRRSRDRLEELTISPDEARRVGIKLSRDGAPRRAIDLLADLTVDVQAVGELWPEISGFDQAILETLVNDARYAPYIERQARGIAEMRRDQSVRLPSSLNYRVIPGLSAELAGKLEQVRPADLAQASRIDGMTPAALSLLLARANKRIDAA